VLAVVHQETRSVSVQEVAETALEAGSDALIRATSRAICGTDLHTYDGRAGPTRPDRRPPRRPGVGAQACTGSWTGAIPPSSR
jgi:glutathione-independent formaldehyde dehydrogenase